MWRKGMSRNTCCGVGTLASQPLSTHVCTTPTHLASHFATRASLSGAWRYTCRENWSRVTTKATAWEGRVRPGVEVASLRRGQGGAEAMRDGVVDPLLHLAGPVSGWEPLALVVFLRCVVGCGARTREMRARGRTDRRTEREGRINQAAVVFHSSAVRVRGTVLHSHRRLRRTRTPAHPRGTPPTLRVRRHRRSP